MVFFQTHTDLLNSCDEIDESMWAQSHLLLNIWLDGASQAVNDVNDINVGCWAWHWNTYWQISAYGFPMYWCCGPRQRHCHKQGLIDSKSKNVICGCRPTCRQLLYRWQAHRCLICLWTLQGSFHTGVHVIYCLNCNLFCGRACGGYDGFLLLYLEKGGWDLH